MKILRKGFDLASFFQKLGTKVNGALLLDYDGTLAPFRVEREKAVPYPGVREILDDIMEAGKTRLILISGRSTKDLIPLLQLKKLPEIWGSHGWERLLPGGEREMAQPDRRALRALAEANTWSDEITALGGRIEQKPACLAVHWRGLDPEAVKKIRGKVLGKWALLGQESGLNIHEFDGGIELRVAGRDKGYAVEKIYSEAGKDAVIAYLGDDLTDEDAFRAIKGKGLGVLVRSELRPTAADLWLRPPDELLAFLARWAETSGNIT